MRLSGLQLALGLSAVEIALAFPFEDVRSHQSLNRRIVSPDNTCGMSGHGDGQGYMCHPTPEDGGECCSAAGWCGSSMEYCDTGCQIKYGVCKGSEVLPPHDNSCGSNNGGKGCLGGLCCSASGWCGNTTDYCAAGCQTNFGDCLIFGVAIDQKKNSFLAGNERCGPNFDDENCPTGQCCSPEGYCGITESHCSDPDCQYKYGTCDSDTTPTGASTLGGLRPRLGQVTYDDDIHSCTQNDVVALTYDDGPYQYTSQLLDILQEFGFHATFFITGNNNHKGSVDTTDPYPDLIRRMVNEGHQVASHTWSHYSLDKISSDMRMQQMAKNERAIANIIGMYPTYMRPPYSQCETADCKTDMNALGYHRVYFDLDTQDYLNPLPSQIQNAKDIVAMNLGSNTTSSLLSIQHDIVEQSVKGLASYYFNLISEKGWRGVTAGECLQDPEENWYRVPEYD